MIGLFTEIEDIDWKKFNNIARYQALENLVKNFSAGKQHNDV